MVNQKRINFCFSSILFARAKKNHYQHFTQRETLKNKHYE